MEIIWVVNCVSYVDDYKLRGQEPATIEETKVFKSEQKAYEYAHSWEIDYCTVNYGLKDEDELDDLKNGEFVPSRFESFVEKCVLDESENKKRRKN